MYSSSDQVERGRSHCARVALMLSAYFLRAGCELTNYRVGIWLQTFRLNFVSSIQWRTSYSNIRNIVYNNSVIFWLKCAFLVKSMIYNFVDERKIHGFYFAFFSVKPIFSEIQPRNENFLFNFLLTKIWPSMGFQDQAYFILWYK